ncbi:Fic family protein [Clostridium sp.]|uniref:Fic family protein n=1 Tax=Clostridium sp. TaxID=1506 RepID=UPI003F38559C
MDKQIIDEFNRLYFSKRQLERRIYKSDDFNEIWNYIFSLRMDAGIKLDLEFSESSKFYYSKIEDIGNYSRDVDNNKENEIWSYISNNNKEKILKRSIVNEIYNSILNNSDNKKEINRKELAEKSLQNSEIVKFITDLGEENNEFNNKIMEKIYKNILLAIDDDIKNVYKSEEDKLVVERLIDFVKNDNETSLLLKAAIINFYISFKKPFYRYNECISRLASYSYLILNGYEIVKYISLSKKINSDSKRYNSTIENCIDSNGDLTYFIKYYINILKDSIISFNKEVSSKYGKKILKSLIEKNNIKLDKRISEFIYCIMASNNDVVTIEDYKKIAGVSYETARTDLNTLVTLGVFKLSKTGKKYEYYINDISTIIDSFNE